MGQPAPSHGGPGTTRGGYAKGDARRELIVDVASEIFGTQGFRAATMLQIAAACGISRTGLLHHFPTKESLLGAVLARRDHRPTDPDAVTDTDEERRTVEIDLTILAETGETAVMGTAVVALAD